MFSTRWNRRRSTETRTHTHTHCSLKLFSTIIYVSKSNPYKYSNTNSQHPRANAQWREIRLRFKNVTISLVLQQTKHALTARNLFMNNRVRCTYVRAPTSKSVFIFRIKFSYYNCIVCVFECTCKYLKMPRDRTPSIESFLCNIVTFSLYF